MFRVGSGRSVVRRYVVGGMKVVGGTTFVGVAGVGLYCATEPGRGLRRELQFWSVVGPIVFDYYWNVSSTSPYVKYQNYIDDNKKKNKKKQREKEKVQQLHEQHAPEILQILLDLKGLYIKLGQVLSVTALPVPESYRERFKTLQSDVPGYEMFEETVKPVIEQELGQPIEEIFESIDPIPCGAASIGQAHKAILKKKNTNGEEKDEEVIIKVQYPDAAWQIPADIQCVGDFMTLCVFFGVLDETSAKLSYDEFSRQFLSELNYHQERKNLEDIYQSSLDPTAPYIRRNVIVPKVYPTLCTSKIITMSYLPGPKLEEEAKRQLEALGINTKGGIRGLMKRQNQDGEESSRQSSISSWNDDNDEVKRYNINKITTDRNDDDDTNDETNVKKETDIVVLTSRSNTEKQDMPSKPRQSQWDIRNLAFQIGSKLVSVNSLLGTVRFVKSMILWWRGITVQSIDFLSTTPLLKSIVPTSVQTWSNEHQHVREQSKRLALTKDWMDALLDVHGHQIFHLGCFNADAHPGNILVVDEHSANPKLGLIDFGQCKRLTLQEQAQVAKLIVSVANHESDEFVAAAFRELGVQTKNDSTEYLSKFARLMFGPLQTYHLNHKWHQELQQLDSITYFPNQLSMVYRTGMLLRGLAISLQFNISISELWKVHAEDAIQRYHREMVTTTESTSLVGDADDATSKTGVVSTQQQTPPKIPYSVGIRRMTTTKVVKDLQEMSHESK